MSRIYEALKNAEEMRAKSEMAAGEGLGIMEMMERRGSARVDLELDISVYGADVADSPFYEQAKAVKGNAGGGMFLLAVPVLEGKDLLLINNRTSEEQICRVVNVTIRDAQTSQVGVVFPSPNAQFWGLPS